MTNKLYTIIKSDRDKQETIEILGNVSLKENKVYHIVLEVKDENLENWK